MKSFKNVDNNHIVIIIRNHIDYQMTLNILRNLFSNDKFLSHVHITWIIIIEIGTFQIENDYLVANVKDIIIVNYYDGHNHDNDVVFC